MTNDQREIRRKLRILEHAQTSGDVSRTCRYFGIGRASFYRWCQSFQAKGEAGLANKRSVPHNHPNKTPDDVVEKVLHLRREVHPASCGVVPLVSWASATRVPPTAMAATPAEAASMPRRLTFRSWFIRTSGACVTK